MVCLVRPVRMSKTGILKKFNEVVQQEQRLPKACSIPNGTPKISSVVTAKFLENTSSRWILYIREDYVTLTLSRWPSESFTLRCSNPLLLFAV